MGALKRDFRIRAGGALLAWAGLASPALAQGAPDDEAVRKAWSYLTPQEQIDVAGWFRAEVEQVDCFQNRVLRFALALESVDPGLFPEDEPCAYFDPVKHAPKQPIPRKRLDADDGRVQALHETIYARHPKGPVRSAWRYDWGRREVLRTRDFQLPEHVFENALAGYAPGVDLAQALVERALDGGEQQVVLAAFGHAYTDRAGLVYPGVTLYDAWSSGTEFEMPDVDALGLVATITGKPPRWKAPVPESQHDELYAQVGRWFEQGREYRGLRAALAQTYFVGKAPLPVAFRPHLARLHGLWEEYGSDPTALAKELPAGKDGDAWLQRWAKKFDKDAKRLSKAGARQTTLEWDASQVRALLVRILEEQGAFERKARPAVTERPAPTEKGSNGGG
jgi:hypothetical protein